MLAETSDLFVTYSSFDRIHQRLGIPLFVGTHRYPTTRTIRDADFLPLLQSLQHSEEPLTENLNANYDYFQTREISNLLYTHLRVVQSSIRAANSFRERYGQNRDCMVHIRLTDTTHENPGYAYYASTIRSILSSMDTLYVATDQPSHPMIAQLMTECRPPEGAAHLVTLDEVETLQFGSTCKFLVLSNGSYSAVMGWLAFDATEIHYPKYKSQMWHGDMFSIPSWIEETCV